VLLGASGTVLAAPVERRARRSDARVGVALVYHAVGEPGGDLRRELLPALAATLFEEQVRYLASRYTLVGASALLEAASNRRAGEPFPVAITLDDDLRSHVGVAAPILRRTGATATFFLCGSSLHGPHRFWWERLQEAFDRGLDFPDGGDGGPGRASIHDLAREIEALPADRVDAVDDRLRAIVGPDPPDAGLRTDEVAGLVGEGFEVGFHTRRHRRLPGRSDEELGAAMQEGRPDLEAIVGRPLTAIAYPHGDADERVAAAARAAGFAVGFTGEGRAVARDGDPLLLGRVSPSYASVGELAFDVAAAIAGRSRR
jgi:peptidoglycan/xylan/chitin deacetylase (PgdA/CDA1 family)